MRAIDNEDVSLDREQLRILTLQALLRDFPPPRAGQKDELKSSDTRCWLLSALGRLSDGDQQSAEKVRKHLDSTWEPYHWARYWALEGLIAGKAPDLHEIATRLAHADEEPLVSNLATAILACKGDPQYLALVETNLNGDEVEKWSMLRALRIVPIAETGIVRQLCDIVENAGYSDLTFDAIVALGKLPVNSQVAESAAQTLSNYLIKYRWPMYDAMRTRALIALGNLNVERTSAVLIEELSDDSPAIVYEAGRALEKVIGVRTATARLLEAAIKSGPDSVQKFANALRSMNRATVIEELESVLRSGSEAQQEIARTLMSEVGGMDAFQRLRARENAVNKYIGAMEAAEAKVRKLFEDSIVEARQGFKLATIMDLIVFAIGILLIAGSAGRVLASGNSLDSWAGVGLTGGTGVLGVLYGILIANPRRQVRESVDHLMQLKVVFLAYLRQLHQTDQAYTRRLLEDTAFPATEVAEFSRMIGGTMTEALLKLSGHNPDSHQ
jgi:HEAT repeat protein